MNHRIWILIMALFILAGGGTLYGEEAKSGNVTVDFKDAPIESVLRTLSYKSGVNIVYSRDVTGLITIRLKDVSWEKALDVILKTYGYGYDYDKEANIIRVATPANLKQEEVITKVFTLNYAKADAVAGSIEKILTKDRGKVQYDERTNLLIVTDIPAVFTKTEEVIARLDRKTLQVTIEAKIVETVLGDDERLGIDWTTRVTAFGSVRPMTFPFSREAEGGDFWPEDDPASSGPAFPTKAHTRFPMVTSDKFTFGALDFSEFQAVLEVLKSRSDTNILSNPRITTLDNQEAQIMVGTIIPIPVYEWSTETKTRQISGYDEQEVGIKLKVTPHINLAGYITMDIEPEVSKISGWTGPDNERPIISTRQAKTQVMVRDGQTLVIGGLVDETEIESERKVPLLGDIPLLGFFFKKKSRDIDKTDILIFITPRIVEGESLTTASSKAQ